ncbi:hypothetical protein [Actinomyces sp.]|uniref:hypothetical protein n=1 Tax=Actinomyces sp. TaxID=29317 RepID=UPI0026DC1032|nr:hypothetical protein [Actinomyces sp.]MDO4900395.1 hypothetical protein [Actinomyces sp.]
MTTATSSPPAPMLRDGVEKIVGMDGLSLLHDTANGTYHRVGDVASAMIDLFDGHRTPEQIASAVNAQKVTPVLVRAAHVDALTRGLADQQLLVGGTPGRRRRTGLDRMMPRFTISRGFARILAPVVEIIRPLYRRGPLTAAAVVALVGYIAGLTRITTVGANPAAGATPLQLSIAALIALPIQLFAILMHESWHGIVCGVHGQPARGLGVAMLFWVVPVAYVDRTDAYRIRERGPRVAIALAGMVNDGWIMGATTIVASVSTGTTRLVATTLMGYQLILLVANLNPLAPSDTVSALEAATGEIDLRGRSRTLLVSTIRRRRLPGYLTALPAPRRIAYMTYGVLSYLFATWVVLFVAWSFWRSIAAAVQGVAS